MAAPELLPGRRPLPPGAAADLAPHATTIVALACAGGVVMAGDRRATMGNLIASRDIEKVHAADPYSLVGVAGTAGVGIEMIRLFQVELEHYEKIEGAMLSLDGKANRLAAHDPRQPRRGDAGLAVVPLYAGYDLAATDPAKAGRIFSFDVAGGLYEETGYDAIGSGLAVRQVRAEEALPSGPDRRRGDPAGGRGALRRGRRRHRHRRPGPDPQDLPGGHDRHRRGHPPAQRRGGRRRSPRRWSPAAWRTLAADPAPQALPVNDRREGDVRHRGHAVLRLARADHARPRGVRAQEHRPRPQRRGAQLRRAGCFRRREHLHRAAQGQRDLRPDRVRRGRPLQRVREPAPGRGAHGRPAAATATTGAT